MHDLISRQAAIKAICEDGTGLESHGCTEITMAERKQRDADILSDLPSAQTEIIYCKDCKKHNKVHGRYYDGTFVGMMDCCPLAEIRGAAQGHEFDYQFCAYAERRGEKDG